MDWHQLWEIVSAPDNVPIVASSLCWASTSTSPGSRRTPMTSWSSSWKADAALAKTHHRKTWPFKAGWQKEVHVWPFLLRIEFLAAIIVTIILMIWSITLNAPLEEPANPNLTMNPAKAPVVFPRPAGNAGVLRPVDRRRSHADTDHHRTDGDSLYRYQPEGQRLLHLETNAALRFLRSCSASSFCGWR